MAQINQKEIYALNRGKTPLCITWVIRFFFKEIKENTICMCSYCQIWLSISTCISIYLLLDVIYVATIQRIHTTLCYLHRRISDSKGAATCKWYSSIFELLYRKCFLDKDRQGESFLPIVRVTVSKSLCKGIAGDLQLCNLQHRKTTLSWRLMTVIMIQDDIFLHYQESAFI